MFGAGKELIERLPEAKGAVAHGKIGRDLKATTLDVDQQLAPALRTFANTGLEADKFLLALGCGADQNQHAFGMVFHPGLQIDPVRPHIDIVACRNTAGAARL